MSRNTFRICAVLLGLLVIGVILHLMVVKPPTVDEVRTYRYFTSEGWKVALSSYYFPNNHVLFSLLTTAMVQLPLPPFLALRLVSFLVAFCNGYVIYKTIGLKCNSDWSLFGVLIWVSSFSGMFFSIHARGYGLMLLFVVSSLYVVLRIVDDKAFARKQIAWLSLAGISALGFFTIPVFLFPYTSILLILVFSAWQRNSHKQLFYVVEMGLVTTVATVILYAPILYYYGLNFLIGHQYIDERKVWNLSRSLLESFPVDLFAYIGPLAAVTFLVSFFGKESIDKTNRFYLFAFILSPMILMFVMMSIPYPRTFFYLGTIIIIFSVSWVYSKQMIRKEAARWIVVLVVFLSIGHSTSKIVRIGIPDPGALGLELYHQSLDLENCDVIYSKDWNEAAEMLDFYSWYYKKGPQVKVIYDGDFHEEFSRLNGRYVISGRDNVYGFCSPVISRKHLTVYDCFSTENR